MDGVAAAAQSVEAVNQILQQATAQTMETAEKMVRVNAEMALGVEAGKGTLFDAVA